MSDAALDLMYGLVLENGKHWGEVAADFQKDDAEAIFAPAQPHKHFITRPRGGSKTTDIGGAAISWLVADAPQRSRGYVVASNGEQAGILIDAAAGLVARTPELDGVLTLENERIVNPTSGAWVRVLNQSDSGAWGLRDAHLLILDEFAQWPETRGAKRVYTAVRSTVQKVPGCRLIILTSAGEPSHWCYEEVFLRAMDDPDGWRVSQAPGPVPWQDPIELEALRRELTPSQYERLVLNIWSEDEDRAVSPEDYELAAQDCRVIGGGRTTSMILHGPKPGIRYIITVDIGTRSDATVMVVAHKEPVDPDDRFGPHRLVVDHLERWQGSKKEPVQLKAVEDWLVEVSMKYNRAAIHGDPDQFVGTLQNLNRRGVKAAEWIFSAKSVGQVATALVQTFRNGLIHVPRAKVLKDELLRVKLRESAPGVTRLDHERSGHDDQAVAIGMAAHILLGNTGWGAGAAFKAFMKDQVAKREAAKGVAGSPDHLVVGRAMQRHVRMSQLNKRAPRLAREKAVSRCQHRWRDGRCVFCPEVRQEVST